MKRACDLSRDQLLAVVESIQDYLYLDLDANGVEFWNGDKSWSGDEFDYIGQVLSNHSLVPGRAITAVSDDTSKSHLKCDNSSDTRAGHRVYGNPNAAASDANPSHFVRGFPVRRSDGVPVQTDAESLAHPCECQLRGDYCSGVPGILARVENCQVVVGGKVERCDQCQRYISDQAAHDKLVELGMA